VRVRTYGEDLRITDWKSLLARVKADAGVVAAAPFVLDQGLVSAGHDFREGAYIAGIEPQGRGVDSVTSIRQHAIDGDFRFISSDGQQRGVVIGRILASKLNAYPGDTIAIYTTGGIKVNAATGSIVPIARQLEVTGVSTPECTSTTMAMSSSRCRWRRNSPAWIPQ
jgi:lipoprotein-releasing system permease protein